MRFGRFDDDVELWDVRVKNRSERERAISLFNYVEWSFQHIDIDNRNFQMSLYAAGCGCEEGVIEFDFFYEPWTFHFLAAAFEPDGFDCVRDRFIGPYRTESDPVAVAQGACSGSSELGGNHSGAFHKKLLLAPGEERRLVFVLGVGSRREKGLPARAKYSDPSEVDGAFAALADYWKAKTSVLQVRTPNAGMNAMLNTWNLYQAETCVVWSRFAFFIEVGGRTGLGFRDTAQDVISVVHTNPEKTEQRLVELLGGVTARGYGLHLFDPDVFKERSERFPSVKLPTVIPSPRPEEIVHGIDDACADDALWLVAAVCARVREWDDVSFFDRIVSYADGGEGSVYEHLKRILDFSAEQVGSGGICKGLRADWNDCLNLGGGESAMVSFMHYWALGIFVEAAARLGRDDDAAYYAAMASRVGKACEETLWDGGWYLRGFTRKGRAIGTGRDREGKLFLNAQTWAVLSGAASRERGEKAMNAAGDHLASPFGLHLLWPSYSEPDDDIGYVTRVYKGVKENGSIFSHTNPWAVIAECVLGRGDRAMQYYDAILPYNQNDRVEVREAEPYSYCQFVMGRDHSAFGRARHPWLTGSAGWFYTAATQHILGIRVSFDGLVIDPCIPAEWPGFEAVRRWRGATYEITVSNPDGVEKGVEKVSLNGRTLEGPIPDQPAGSVNHVAVVMGRKFS